ncbi:Crp/Fnr family transcriptional regulator, partial [Vibrio splendidus]
FVGRIQRFGTSSRVYRRAVKDLLDKGFIRKGDQGLEIVDQQALRAFIDSYE